MHYKGVATYRIDVTEAQWLIIIVEIMSFVCGVDMWTIVVSGCGLDGIVTSDIFTAIWEI